MTGQEHHDRPLHIAVLVTRMDLGGVPDHIMTIVTGLAGRCRFTLICDHVHAAHAGQLQELGVEVLPTQLERTPDPMADIRAVVRLVGIIRAGGFDVLHTHMSKAALLGAIAGRIAGCRAIVNTAHNLGFIAMQSQTQRALFWVYDKLLLAAGTDAVVTVSRSVGERARAARLVPARKLHVIHNGIRTARFIAVAGDGPATPRQTLTIVTVARLVWFKGLDTLIRAMRAVVDTFPQARLVIVGGGELESQLRAQAASLDLTAAITFAGEREDVPVVLAAADLFVLPSVSEGLPVSILEAMACGLAVVATRVGGVPELVEEGVTGLLVEPGQPHAMATAICRLLADERERRTMGLAGRGRLEANFSAQAMVEATEQLYRTLAARRTPELAHA